MMMMMIIVQWCFCFYAQAICGIIRTTAEPIFAEYIGKYQIKAIEFDQLSLGTLPPTICGKSVFLCQCFVLRNSTIIEKIHIKT